MYILLCASPLKELRPAHTVHAQDHSRDIRRLVGSKKRKGIGDIFRLSQSSQRNLGNQRINNFLGYSLHHIRFRDTRRHRIDTDSLRPKFPCERDRKSIYRKLGACPEMLTMEEVERITPLPCSTI